MSQKSLNKYFELIQERSKEFITNNFLKIITDRKMLEQYEKQNNCDLGVVYESDYHLLVVDLVCSNDNIFKYERLIKRYSGNCVVIIPIYNEKFVLLNQYRYSLQENQICFPRGFGESGLKVEENAKKEIKEEINADTISCDIIGTVVADSGVCGEKVAICLCEISKPFINEHYENIDEINLCSIDELTELIKNNAINDGYTLSALSLYMLNNGSQD